MAIKENKKTVRRFQDAIDVQNACNPSGISYSMHEYYKSMLDAGASTSELQTDCAMSLFIIKLADLAGIAYSTTTYGIRLRPCRQWANHYRENPPSE